MPKPPRFFISQEQIKGNEIFVTGDDVRHILTVLRMRPGDELLLLDGKGREYTVRITSTGKSEITTEILSAHEREIRPPFITLCQGIPKADKMDWIVQKATELGVSSIIPLVTERTVVRIRDQERRIARWQKIVREAAMQSNRADIPSIGRIVSFKDFLPTLDFRPRTLLLLPWEEATRHIKTVLRRDVLPENIFVFIGPEGGFTAEEARAAEETGAEVVSLGSNILRTETAAVAVLSMILYETSTK